MIQLTELVMNNTKLMVTTVRDNWIDKATR